MKSRYRGIIFFILICCVYVSYCDCVLVGKNTNDVSAKTTELNDFLDCSKCLMMTTVGEDIVTNVQSSLIVSDGTLEIPDKIESFFVRAITENAFAGNPKIRKVSLPSSVSFVKHRAFAGCSNLSSVVMHYDKVDTKSYNKGVRTIHREAFLNCVSLTNVVFSSEVCALQESVFQGCSSLREIILPESVSIVSDSAFDECRALRRVDLSMVWGDVLYLFRGCHRLEEICVSPSNETYKIYDGALYYRDCRALVRVPPMMKGNVFVVHNGVRAICPFAFEKCGFKSVVFPEGLVCIGPQSFSSCTNLLSITIPQSVADIEEYAFVGCQNLKEVIFLGKKLPRIDPTAFLDNVKFRHETDD